MRPSSGSQEGAVSAEGMAAARYSVPEHVLIQEINGQSVLLHLDTEVYYGLDDVGTEMWKALAQTASLVEAEALFLAKYDVEPDRLSGDLLELVTALEKHGLLARAD
jgi:hypothetical protein